MVPAPGLSPARQAVPSQCRVSGFEISPDLSVVLPAAHISPAEIAAIALSVLPGGASGGCTMFHPAPSQCSNSGCEPLPFTPVEASPTAHTLSAASATTALRLLIGPLFGLGITCHLPPCRRR